MKAQNILQTAIGSFGGHLDTYQAAGDHKCAAEAIQKTDAHIGSLKGQVTGDDGAFTGGQGHHGDRIDVVQPHQPA